MIVQFDENFQPAIEAQYPREFSKDLELKASDLMNIYTLHRMDKTEPNFYQMEIKDYTVASFFTGFSLKHYVGRPDYAIITFFTNEEINNSPITPEFEGFLRRIAHEILPKKNQQNFNDLIIGLYDSLENTQLEPYWDEYNEDEINLVVALPAQGKIDKEPLPVAHNEDVLENERAQEDLGMQKEEEMDKEKEISENEINEIKLENEVLKAEIETLELLNKEKDTIINELKLKIPQKIPEEQISEELEEKIKELKKENKEFKQKIDELSSRPIQKDKEKEEHMRLFEDLKKNLNTKDVLIKELNQKVDTLTGELDKKKEVKDDALKFFKEAESIKKENKILREEIEKLKKENNLYIDSIANLKIELKTLKQKVTAEDSDRNDLSETIIDLKKEIKVLRRERDHYKEIIKEHNLL
jgi:hypothetical protein